MRYSELPCRKKIRLSERDYSSAGAYFVTICIRDRCSMLWEIGEDQSFCLQMLSKYGKVVEEGIINILDCYENVSVDQFCIMPDHVHMVLILYGKGEDGRIISAPTLSSVVGQMKR